jgi:hypothetical protein
MTDFSLPAALRQIPYLIHVEEATLATVAERALRRTFVLG